MTDINGEYSIQVVKGEELVFSFIGYVSASVKVGKGNTIDVRLAADIMNLEEVVVTAFGVQNKKSALSYAIIEVADEESINEEVLFELDIECKIQSR